MLLLQHFSAFSYSFGFGFKLPRSCLSIAGRLGCPSNGCENAACKQPSWHKGYIIVITKLSRRSPPPPSIPFSTSLGYLQHRLTMWQNLIAGDKAKDSNRRLGKGYIASHAIILLLMGNLLLFPLGSASRNNNK